MNSQDLIFRAKNYPKQKSLGQNFLVNASILDRIVSSCKLDPESQVVIEIGPGIGFLTERLLPQVKHLFSIELDANAVKYLTILQANYKNFDFLRDDILALNVEDIFRFNTYYSKLQDLGLDVPEGNNQIQDDRKLQALKLWEQIQSGELPKIKIIANIPYQITTKILLHFLGEIGEESINKKFISEIDILVQKEFADRLLAKPGTKAYGAITLLLSYYANIERLVEVPRDCFMPSPEVDSTFIRIKLLDSPRVDCTKPKAIRRFIKAIFANRRKKLKNGLKAAGYSDEEINKLNLDENLRGETLSLEEINSLVNQLIS